MIGLKYTNFGSDRELAQASRRILARALWDLHAAAGLLSEQLTSQHFSHVDFELRAVSA